MAETLSWTFGLFDKLSGPAKHMSESLGTFDKEISKVDAKLNQLKADPGGFKKLQSAKKELKEFTGGGLVDQVKAIKNLESVRLGAEVFMGAVEAGKKLVEVTIDIGKEILHAAGAAERAQISFEALLGKREGHETLEYIEKIAQASELTGVELKGLASHLLRAGFSAKDLEKALPAALDVAGFLGGGTENVEKAVSALERIQLTGKITGKALVALGLSSNDVAAQIAKDTGGSAKEIKKHMKDGTANVAGLNAVYELIQKKQGGALGTTAEKVGKGMDAKLKHLAELPERYFEKFANSPAFEKVKSTFDRILEKLDPESAAGKRIFAALEGAVTNVANIVDGIFTPENIDLFANGLTTALGYAKELPEIFDKVKLAIEAVTFALTATFRAGYAFGEWIDKRLNLSTKFANLIGDITGQKEKLQNIEDLGVKINQTKLEIARLKSEAGDRAPAVPVPGAKQVAANSNVTVHVGGITVHGKDGDDGKAHADEIAKHLPGAAQKQFEKAKIARSGG